MRAQMAIILWVVLEMVAAVVIRAKWLLIDKN
jgi:hypothetical protein